VSEPHTESTPRRLDLPALRLDWSPDVPDHRDYSPAYRKVAAALSQLKAPRGTSDSLSRIDWRAYAPAVTISRPQVASAVETCIDLIEHFERRASGRQLQLSRAFLDYAAERFRTAVGGSVTLRTVLKASRRCGVPPEKFWTATDGAREPPDALAYGFQRYFGSIRYVRLDSPQATGDETLRRVRAFLTAGFPIAFGFAVSNSLGEGPDIWYPTAVDDSLGGIAAAAVGFDDRMRIRSDKGALLVRGVWGKQWGDAGYAWLPYSFVRQRLATDFWTLIKPAWLRSGEFAAPQL
jgi:C1A family cysteine protease